MAPNATSALPPTLPAKYQPLLALIEQEVNDIVELASGPGRLMIEGTFLVLGVFVGCLVSLIVRHLIKSLCTPHDNYAELVEKEETTEDVETAAAKPQRRASAYMKTSQLKRALRAAGADDTGSREELMDRLDGSEGPAARTANDVAAGSDTSPSSAELQGRLSASFEPGMLGPGGSRRKSAGSSSVASEDSEAAAAPPVEATETLQAPVKARAPGRRPRTSGGRVAAEPASEPAANPAVQEHLEERARLLEKKKMLEEQQVRGGGRGVRLE